MGEAYIVRRGGGANLNFKVVGSLTPPSNPSENTIWINTVASVTAWAFSAAAPAGPVEGMVWIQTGIASHVAINALKKNNVTIYPVYAYQYIGGAWISKSAMTFQGGSWVPWVIDTTLYDSGAFNAGVPYFKSKTPEGSTITYSENCINMTTVADKVCETYVGFGPLNIAGYSKLVVVLSNTSSRNIKGCAFVSAISNDFNDSAIKTAQQDLAGSTSNVTIELDLTGLSLINGYVYAGFNTNGEPWNYSRTGLQVHSVKLLV